MDSIVIIGNGISGLSAAEAFVNMTRIPLLLS